SEGAAETGGREICSMTKPLDPILGPDGKRLWVTAREYIGAEEVIPRTTISWDTQLRHDGRGKVYRWESRSPEKSAVDSPPSVRRMRSFASFVAMPSTSF